MRAFVARVPLARIKDVRGTCYLAEDGALSAALRRDIESGEALICPSYDEVRSDKRAYADAFRMQSDNSDFSGKTLLQKHGGLWLVQNRPQFPLSAAEMDAVYALPYERKPHPSYRRGVPAMEEIEFSITSVRGCFGSCNYCALTYHQGRIVQKRSRESIMAEAKKLTEQPGSKAISTTWEALRRTSAIPRAANS